MKDPDMGGLGIDLIHGSVHIEAAKYENHTTTAVANPDSRNPDRMSLVFYQHKSLNLKNHSQANCVFLQSLLDAKKEAQKEFLKCKP